MYEIEVTHAYVFSNIVLKIAIFIYEFKYLWEVQIRFYNVINCFDLLFPPVQLSPLNINVFLGSNL